MRAARTWVIVGLTLLLAVLTGCYRNPAPKVGPGAPPPAKPAVSNEEAGRFYDALAKVGRKVEDAHLGLAKALDMPSTGKLPGPGDLKKVQDQFARSVAGAKEELKAVKVPSLNGAQQLHDATQRFLEAEEGQVRVAGEIVKAIESGQLGITVSPVDLAKQLEVMGKQRQAVTADLQKAREAFARAHNLN